MIFVDGNFVCKFYTFLDLLCLVMLADVEKCWISRFHILLPTSSLHRNRRAAGSIPARGSTVTFFSTASG